MTHVRLPASHERLTYFARVFWIDHQLRAHPLSERAHDCRTLRSHDQDGAAYAGLHARSALLPLGYSGTRRGWFYTEPAYALPAIEMTYFTAARGELTRRRCDPLHLRNHLGE
jgi:hypothetical protein